MPDLNRRRSSRQKGDWGEALALSYLAKKGYEILERNYRTRHGEIDFTVRDEAALVSRSNRGVLLYSTGEAHRIYAAKAESLYLIRPDGYVDFRCQPAEVEPLIEYLRSKYTDASGGEGTLYREGIGKTSSGIASKSSTRR